MTLSGRSRDDAIRRAIRRNRRIRRIRLITRQILTAAVLALVAGGIIAGYRCIDHGRLWQVRIVDGGILQVEKGRQLPWLEFHRVVPDLPSLHAGEIINITAVSPKQFSTVTARDRYLAGIYAQAGDAVDRSTLSGASRATALLETALRLDPGMDTGETVQALLDLSDRFASKQGKENLLESWRYLKRAHEIAAAGNTQHTGIERRMNHRKASIERKWFYRIREHLLDGNYRAADAIVSELEDCGFDGSRTESFRARLDRLKEGMS